MTDKSQSNLVIGSIATNWGFQPQNLLFLWGNQGLWTQCYLMSHEWVSLPNGISFCPVALAECTSVIDNIHADGQTTLWYVCCNRWNCFQWCHLKCIFMHLVLCICRWRELKCGWTAFSQCCRSCTKIIWSSLFSMHLCLAGRHFVRVPTVGQ